MFRGSRLAALLVCIGLVAVPAAARATPVLTISTDREDGVYATGETATFIIEATENHLPLAHQEVACELSTDAFAHSEKRTVTVTKGQAELTVSRDEPCVLHLRAVVRREGSRPASAVGGAAFSPERIKPAAPAPDDFDAFWADQKGRLDAIPPNVQLEAMDSGPPGVELYSVTLDNIDHTRVHGYLAKPAGEGPFPAYLQVPWAGVYSLETDRVTGPARRGFLALNINAHDIENGQPKPYYTKLGDGPLKGYYLHGRGSRDTCYFLRMYLSCYRAAEYLASRPDWDGRHLIVEGFSQGGGLALATAGLSPHVSAVAASMPAMCDESAAAVGRAPGWPALVRLVYGKPDPRLAEVAGYFDAVNFARRIKVPALVGTGFADMSCPSSSVYAAYNVIPGPKQMVLDPQAAHLSRKPNWDAAYETFQEKQSRRAEPAATN